MKARDIVFELDGTLIDSAPSTPSHYTQVPGF